MNSRYAYDEKAETWPVFVLAVVSVAVVPVTLGSLYGAFFSGKDEAEGKASKLHSDSLPQEIKKFRINSKKKSLLTKKFLFLLFGWLTIGALTYHIKTHEIEAVSNTFDPYEILGIDFGSTEREIKSHFRKLSVKFHPDKIKNDVSEEEKKELEDKFVLISKAYQALTDDAMRENYEKYGHPDGPQETSHGIALPKFLIEGKLSSPILLVLYIIVIGFVLPSIVSSWWNNTRAYTKKGLHNKSATFFVEKLLNYNPSKIVKLDDILNWLSNTYELQESGLSQEEVLDVLNKYLERKGSLSTNELILISKVPGLLLGLIDISSTFRNTDVTLTAVKAHKHFTQAIKDSNKNDILQLPNVDLETVRGSNVSKLGKLFTLPEDQVKATLGIKDEKKLKETLEIASKIPNLELIKAEFKVPGESVVTPSSNSYISIKFLVKSPKHHGVSKYSPDKLKEVDTLETLRDPYKIVSDQPDLPALYSNYSPFLKKSSYIALVILQKDNKISEVPAIFHNLSLSNLELTNEEYLNGEKVEIGTFKIPLTAPTPKELGQYQFRVVVKSLDYFTNDIDTSIIMDVKEPPQLEEIDEVYDIPDPEEDSLAGALASMKGEKVKKIINDDSSDEEDDDESDLEEDFTDINTDTEDEAE